MHYKDFATGDPNPQPHRESWWERMAFTGDDFLNFAQTAVIVICLIAMVCGLIVLLAILPSASAALSPWSKAVHFIA
ncbi:MAG: hypothetical protein VB099_16490 [Candidatus Limiplasma sp.]|nr:hypothetical protein [Candidatus Limiplasma sp.]